MLQISPLLCFRCSHCYDYVLAMAEDPGSIRDSEVNFSLLKQSLD